MTYSQRNQNIILDREQGMTVKELAEKYFLTEGRIAHILMGRKHFCKCGKPIGNKFKFCPECKTEHNKAWWKNYNKKKWQRYKRCVGF